MTVTFDDLRMNKTVVDILRKFPPIQNKPKYEYHRRGGRGKNIFYGLKSSDFNKFDFDNGDRIFNYWRDRLVQRGLLLKIFPNKDKGSPYAITPFGIANLIQNTELDLIEITNCINVIKHFYKGDTSGLEFKNLGPYINTFRECCDLIRFNEDQITIQTKVMPNTKVDIQHIPYTLHPKQLEKDFELVSYYLISNLCWLFVSIAISALPLLEPKERKELEKIFDSLPTKVIKLGKTFGKKVSEFLDEQNNITKKILDAQNNVVKEILVS